MTIFPIFAVTYNFNNSISSLYATRGHLIFLTHSKSLRDMISEASFFLLQLIHAVFSAINIQNGEFVKCYFRLVWHIRGENMFYFYLEGRFAKILKKIWSEKVNILKHAKHVKLVTSNMQRRQQNVAAGFT